jgi:hypothetical protein
MPAYPAVPGRALIGGSSPGVPALAPQPGTGAPPLPWQPPAQSAGNVLYGTGILFTATAGTPLPPDASLGNGSAWTGLGWAYIGATLDGVTVTRDPQIQALPPVEGEIIPAGFYSTAGNVTITCNMAEEALANAGLSWGSAGLVALTPPGAGQPGKSALSFPQAGPGGPPLAAALIGQDAAGYAQVLSVPLMASAGQVQTAYRRSAQQRVYPLALTAVCALDDITLIILTAPAAS